MEARRLELMDTTLRDGEQTSGVSFLPSEKLHLAKALLEELIVDRIEVASARVSAGELEGVQRITQWAAQKGYLDKVEVLGFVDTPISVDWIVEAGAQVLNLLTKGSLNHLVHQLKKTPEEHFAEIQQCIAYALEQGLQVNVYLEDWSNGMRSSRDYTLSLIEMLAQQPIQRVMLPDTLGILSPAEVRDFLGEVISKFPSLRFDFHGNQLIWVGLFAKKHKSDSLPS